MNIPTLQKADIAEKKVLIRLDLNAPMKDGVITDTTRLKRVLPTLKYLQSKGAKTIICAHLGRPKGQAVAEFSLKPVASKLAEMLGAPVQFSPTTTGTEAETAANELSSGAFLMLENLRFQAAEESNDSAFAQQLAALADVYVNDAFSVSHRAHASVEAITHELPSYAGLLMEEELTALENALGNPTRPVMAVVGGSKVSTKVDLLQNLIGKVDILAIGGGMANTFLLAQDKDIAASFCDRESADLASSIMAKAVDNGCEILLPTDAVVAEKLEEGVTSQTVSVDAVPSGTMILDAGPASVTAISAAVDRAKTLVWNGPLGVFEIKPFDAATSAVAAKVASATGAGALLSVAGGGDTVSALNNACVEDRFSYVSTAGGAFLEWLEGKDLPGVSALKKSARQQQAA